MRIIAMVAVIIAGLLACGDAHAHATLVGSDPAADAIIPSAPQRLVLTFNEPVAPLVLRLVDPAGGITDLTNTTLVGNRLLIGGLPKLGQGTHLLSYRIISADGHPVGGTLVFSVGTMTTQPRASAEVFDPAVRTLIVTMRWLVYLGLFIGIGGRFFAGWMARGTPVPSLASRAINTSLIVGVLAAIVSVGLQGLDETGLPLSFLIYDSVWLTGSQSVYAITAAIAAASMLLAFVTTWWGQRSCVRLATLLAIAGAGAALAASGHAAAASPQWLMRPTLFLHGVCVAIWAGALIPLAAIMVRERADAVPVLLRFSQAALPAFAMIVIAGAVLAVVQVDDPRAVLTTSYGQVLCLKLVAVLVLLVIAAINRYRLTPAIVQQAAGATLRLTRAIWLEAGLVLAILGLVALWRFTPPPRVITAKNAEPVMAHIHTGRAMADVWLTPGRIGTVDVSIGLLDPDLKFFDAKDVKLELSNPAAGIEPIERAAVQVEKGQWQVKGISILLPGRWTVRVDVLVDDFDKLMLDGEVEIRP